MTPIRATDPVSSLPTHTNGVGSGRGARINCLIDLFTEQAQRHAGSVAIWSATDSLTYRDLERRSNHVASHLVAMGVKADVAVALALPRSTDAMIAILAIWKAGGVYVPLDLSYPAERLELMLADSVPATILTNSEVRDRLPSHVRIVELNRIEKNAAGANSGSKIADDDSQLGYILFTSGSTGRPKGVAMPRGPLHNLIQWQLKHSSIGANDVTAQLAPLSFDVHFQEIFSTWCSGGKLALPTEMQRRDPTALVKLLIEQKVARVFLPFVMLQQLVDAAGDAPLHLREVITAGEQLRITPAIRRFFNARPSCKLFNHYGPTESHVVTAHELTGVPSSWPNLPPIGRPIDGAVIRVVDDEGIECQSGDSGEIWIGGACLARGYLGQPELTAERFIVREKQRYYRTGDLGCRTQQGELNFLGRVDHQVKIRGFRVEPGEIEAALAECPGVRQAIVVAREDAHGEKRLIAYLQPGDPTFREAELRKRLAARLPEWMMPAAFVTLTKWPLTPSGKVDRKALPAPNRVRPSLATDFVAPRTPVERSLAELWCDILQLDEVGIHDPFFDLGGHSLALARVHARLRDQLGIELPITSLFQHATIASLVAAIEAINTGISTPAHAASPTRGKATDAIAIIGMAGRFPGAPDVRKFWENIRAGVESVRTFTDEELLAAGVAPELIRDPDYSKSRAMLAEADRFDAAFFGLQPREAELTDPQHRLFLETAWSALEDSGYVPERCTGRVGVFAGSSLNTYLLNNILGDRRAVEGFVGEFQSGGYNVLVGNDKDYLATRVAYKLNLRGPAVAVQTACSTSLVAVCQAVESIRAGECDMAIAGGVSVTFPQVRGSLYQEGAITSPDGHCRPFDADAKGTVFGEGVAAVVLKPLNQAMADGDSIYAVIRGTGLSNDGSDKVSYLAPSVDGQAEAIRRALDQAEFDAGTIGYVEAHGTGTPLGDPIEVAALSKAFGPLDGTCALGSVKANFGHLEAAAGVTGLIKAALALHHRELPPTPNFRTANPALLLDRTPFRVSAKLQEWKSDRLRRAGVSSLGVGGTNAHVVLEEAPSTATKHAGWKQQLLLLSARTPNALDSATQQFANYLESTPDIELADMAYTLQLGRRRFENRRWVVADNVSRAIDQLRATREPARIPQGMSAPVVFLFPGQGSQFVGMAADLYAAEPTFRAQLDLCSELFRAHLQLDLCDVLFAKPEQEEAARKLITQTNITQPVLFAVEYSLAQMYIGWGVQPEAMFGHSIGEYVAACIAGVMSLQDATSLVARRGQLIHACSSGVMLAVYGSEAEVAALLIPCLEIATINSPQQTVVSGPAYHIEEFERLLSARGKKHKRLTTSHAFHSAMLEPAIEPFRAAVANLQLNAPTIPFISCVTGSWITNEQATDPSYWASQLRLAVRCLDGLKALAVDGPVSLLELGAGTTLVNFARTAIPRERLAAICGGLPTERDADVESVLQSLGELWEAGTNIDWATFHALSPRNRLHLPTYPFERKRYWIEPPPRQGAAPRRVEHSQAEESAATVLDQPVRAPTSGETLAQLQKLFAELGGLTPEAITPNSTFLELGFDSLFLTQGVQAIQIRFGVRVTFRQLLESLDTPGKLAAFLDGQQPIRKPEAATPAEVATPAVKAEAVGFGSVVPLDRSSESEWSPTQLRFIHELIRRVVERTPESKRHVQEFRREHADPRTVSGFSRVWKEMVYPIVVNRSAGSRLWDVDGNEYIDLLNGFGPDLLGHSPPFVVDAIAKQLAEGYEVGPLAPRAGELARLVCEMTGMDRASFVCTGSEAVQAALRAARTVTGREKVVTFARDYHGNFDEVLLRPNPSEAAKPAVPSVPGVPKSAVSKVVVLEYGADASLEIIRSLGPELAAVLVEPVQSRRPELQPRDFLHEIRRITEACGAALIFDEVITGFRLHPGGAQAFFGLRADLATYGKVIGGGMPIGAVAGRSNFMDAFDGGWWQYGDESFPEAGRTFFAGTFVRHPLALAAGLAALKHIKEEGPYLQERLNIRATELVRQINAISEANSVPLRVVHCGSVMFFRVLENSKPAELLFYLMREKGIYILEGFPSYLSTAHTEAELAEIVKAWRQSVTEMRVAGFFSSRAALPDGTIEVPMTESQKGVWLACQMSEQASCAFNETCTFHLSGPFDIVALRKAVQGLIDRHESLRSTFDADGMSQLIRPGLTIEIPLTDLSDREPGERERAIAELLDSADCAAFDLLAGPLLRVRVVRHANDDHIVLLAIHHLICDGWSYDILLRELGALYTAAKLGHVAELPPAPRFSEYAKEQADLAAKGRTRAQNYWLEKFDDLPAIIELPTDRPRTSTTAATGSRLNLPLGAELTAAIKHASAKFNCTPYTTLMTAFAALLHRLSGQTDLVFGIPVAGQAVTGLGTLVGRCINFLPMRLRVEPGESFRDLISRAKSTLLDAHENQEFTYISLLQQLNRKRGLNRPLVSTSFNIDPQLGMPSFEGLACEVRKTPKHFVSFEVNLNLIDTLVDYIVEWEYNSELFDESTARKWVEAYRTLLGDAINRPDDSVAAYATTLPVHVPHKLPASVTAELEQPKKIESVAPRLDAERELLAVWAEVLHVPNLGITDDFFELGGHSMLAAELVSKINERLGHQVPLSAFYTAPTVEKMAAILQRQLETETDSSLVALNATGNRPPLVLIAGVGGHVFTFHKFARLLGRDQPTYAFKAIGVEGTRKPLDRMEDIAAEYVRELLATRPNGPYVLGGYSIGAIIAMEVALQLQRRGNKVPLLLSFDMTAPGYPPPLPLYQRGILHVRNFIARKDRWSYLSGRVYNLRSRFMRLIGQGIRNAPHINEVGAFPQDTLKEVWAGLDRAFYRYRPEAKFDGSLALFRAEQMDEWATLHYTDPQLGWGQWVTGQVESFPAPVAHNELFHEANIERLAVRVSDCIRRQAME